MQDGNALRCYWRGGCSVVAVDVGGWAPAKEERMRKATARYLAKCYKNSLRKALEAVHVVRIALVA